MPFYSVDSKYQQRANRRTGHPGRLFASLGVGLYIPCLRDSVVNLSADSFGYRTTMARPSAQPTLRQHLETFIADALPTDYGEQPEFQNEKR